MRFFYFLFLLLFLLTPFVPAFGSIDPMGSQWLYLSILVLFFFLFTFLFNTSFKLKINTSFLSFISFVGFSFLSFFYSLNTSEFIIEFSRLIILLFILSIYYLIFIKLDISISDLYKVLLLFLFVECIYFFTTVFLFKYFNSSVNLRGISSNVNIQAFSIVFKLPLIIFYFRDSLKSFFKFIHYISLILSVSILFLISSRASFLSLSLIILFYILHNKSHIKSNIIYVLKFLIPGYFITVFFLNPFLNTGKKLNNLTIIDSSSLTRLSFYKEAFISFLDKPFTGVGLGNWKIFGIDAHKNFIDGYIVPYHAHNDFLQIAAEVGIFGLISFLLFFYFIFKIITKSKSLKNSIAVKFAFLLSILVYLIDANLNFPISRPLIQIQFLFIISYIFVSFSDQSIFSFNISKFYLLLFIFISSFTTYISYKVYNSFTLQQNLLTDFKEQNYDTPLDIIEQIDDDLPNITVTTLPIKSLKANYYSKDSIINRFIDLSIKDNPFIKYPQALKSIRFKTNQQLDSSFYFAKNAFYGLPNNELHTATYLSVLTSLRDTLEIDKLYSHILEMNSYNMWNAYLLTNLEVQRAKSESVNEIFNTAIKLYPNDDVFKLYKLRYSKGDSLINVANNYSMLATKQFDQKKYSLSAQTYLKASNIIPEDPSYLENAGHSYYMLNNNNLALNLFDSVINHYDSRSGKAHYLKGLLLFDLYRRKSDPCKLFDLAIKKGNLNAVKAKKIICN